MKKITFLFLNVLLIFSSCAQKTPENYNNLIAEARGLYAAGEFENSAKIYSKAFAAGAGSDTLSHRYEAARAWALAGQKDLAFEQLFETVNTGEYYDLRQISSDRALNSLSTDERWMSILNKVIENLKEVEIRFAEVAVLLETVHGDDQSYRQQVEEIQENYGRDSEEYRAHWELIQKQDSVNLIKVEKILDEHGWLGWNQIGRKANAALFLVIQHADIETQEKYLPMLRKAVKKGDAPPADLALLEDRVALRQGKKQIYGSQIGMDQKTGEYYLSPLQDPDNVDERRAEVGLGPIQEYISHWDLTWDAEDYKKKLAEMEAGEDQ